MSDDGAGIGSWSGSDCCDEDLAHVVIDLDSDCEARMFAGCPRMPQNPNTIKQKRAQCRRC